MTRSSESNTDIRFEQMRFHTSTFAQQIKARDIIIGHYSKTEDGLAGRVQNSSRREIMRRKQVVCSQPRSSVSSVNFPQPGRLLDTFFSVFDFQP